MSSIAVGHVVALLGLVVWTDSDDSGLAAIAVSATALVASVGTAAVLARYGRGAAKMAAFGAALALIGCALLAVTPRGAITVLEASVLGAGAGLLLPRRDELGAVAVTAGLLAAAVEAAAAGAIGGRTGVFRVAAAAVVVLALVSARDRQGTPPAAKRGGRLVVVAASLLAVGLLAWVPANDPTVQWFGGIRTHGDRRSELVALTFDDGPDAVWSLAVAQILDTHGLKGTFFEVGKAVDARPDIVRALRDDGQLLGNHSYHHDYTSWLDPRYPELAATQGAFERAIGQCPALFRPPHGQRTPFMLARARGRGMSTVTWDVSARDWVDRDGRAIAKRVVDRARGGSIILLHDGLDGRVTADRSVLVEALPLILDGLAAKGLRPVRLDQLLGVAPYLDHC